VFQNLANNIVQGDHLSGKPGNVGEFDSRQGNVRDFTENQGIVRGKIFGEKLPKTDYCKLHICVHTGIYWESVVSYC